MKSLFVFTVFYLTALLSYSNSSTACDNLYSKVTYALSHSKKSLNATNFEHQIYYAERALTAMEKVEALKASCDCMNVEDKSYLIIKNLTKAIEPVDWDAGRFFTKKSKGLINELITELDECSTAAYDDTDSETANLESEVLNSTEKNDKINAETLKLAKYISTLEKRLVATEQEITKLLTILESADNSINEGSSSIKIQQKLYLEKSKKLLQKSLNQLNTAN